MRSEFRVLLEQFGTQTALAKALKVSKVTVHKWVEAGCMPPGRALQVEHLSGGEFRAIDLVDLRLVTAANDAQS